jgi:hypothetical protein
MPAFCDHPPSNFTLCLPQHGVSVTPAASIGSFARGWAVLPALFGQRNVRQSLIFGCQSFVNHLSISQYRKKIKVFILIFFSNLKIQN